MSTDCIRELAEAAYDLAELAPDLREQAWHRMECGLRAYGPENHLSVDYERETLEELLDAVNIWGALQAHARGSLTPQQQEVVRFLGVVIRHLRSDHSPCNHS